LAKVLVIDADKEFRRCIGRVLEDSGIEVLEAEDGREGVKAALRHRPAVIVTAIIMPIKDGLEVIGELRQQNYRGPIIAVSGHLTRGALYRQAARLLGANETLAEPFSATELIDAVHRLL
jgi:CheY-like chemotaxis protein